MAKKISNIADKATSSQDSLAVKVLRIFDKMSQRTNWDTTFEEVARLVVPDLNYIFERRSGTNTVGEERHNRLFDSTAEHSAGILASALHSLLTSLTEEFYELTTGLPEIDNRPRVKRYLQRLTKQQHAILNGSNFQVEVREMYFGIITMGTAPIRMDDDDEDIIRFFNSPIFENFIRENHKGVVETIANQKKMCVREAFKKYTMESFGPDAKKLAEDLDKEITIVNIIMSRKDAELERIDHLGRPFISITVYKEGKKTIQTKGFNEFPWAVPRWTKTTGETHGRSPAMKALPDVRYINTIKRTQIRANQKIVDPSLMVVDDGVIGRVNLRPGGLTSVRAMGPNQDVIKPILTGGNLAAGRVDIQDTKEDIKRFFFVDQFQLPLVDRMTTVEVSTRNDDRIRILGPLVARLNNEFLTPMVNRLTGIMKRRKILPDNIPPELANLPLKVAFKSQIAKAIRLLEADNHGRWLASVAPIMEAKPEAAAVLDDIQYIRKMAEFHGVDQTVLRTPKELASIQAAEAEAEQNQQDVENTVQLSQAVKNTENVLPLVRGV